jgi:hypothetical protein
VEQTNGKKVRKEEADRKEGQDLVRKAECDQTEKKQISMQGVQVSLRTAEI